ncbi:MAG: helix-turn-helix domain-containing protein [Planctomycetota bacterium]
MAISKKYLSLEEAAALLKVKTEELIRLREKGDIRGFADRGTWKFKAEDVEEFARRRQPDSDPDVAILDDDEDDELGRQATVIRKGRGSTSDSDVRLVRDDGLKGGLTGSSGELPVLNEKQDSDSDVKLVNPGPLPSDSDSDVKLIEPSRPRMSDSDSDVRLAQSDSDVKIVPLQDSDSDVKLIDQPRSKKSASTSDSDVALLPMSSSNDEGSGSLFDDDPGITLPGDDSGIQLGGDSGIKLIGDSGIRLTGGGLYQPADSGILLEGDSGLTLGHEDCSITLSEDSGLKMRPSSISKKGGSSKNLKGRGKPANDLDATAPMLLARDSDSHDDLGATAPMLLSDDDLDATMDVPLLSDDDDQASTSVIMFDEEDADQSSATVVKKGRKPVDATLFDLDADGEGDEFEDDELEVSDEVLGEDDELEDLDAFETDEDEFDESFEAGASRIGFGAGAAKIAAPQEAEWGTGFFLSLMLSGVVLLFGALMSADLLRTTWAGESTVYQGELLDKVGDLFK